MKSGPWPNAKSATVGVQVNGEATQIVYEDGTLLSQYSAFALDTGSCVASEMHVPDNVSCRHAVTATPLHVPICAGSADVNVLRPPVPSICGRPTDVLVLGSVYADEDRQPVAVDGTVKLYAGGYDAVWQLYRHDSIEPDQELMSVGRETVQPIHVSVVEDTDTCCSPLQNTVVLSSTDNRYWVSVASCVAGQDGSDSLVGSGYNDTLLGQADHDDITGDDGDDVLVGGDGDDLLWGDGGHDVLLGGSGADMLDGGAGPDELWGAEGDDLLYGGADGDLLVAGGGIDFAGGGAGDDNVIVRDLCEIEPGDVLDGGADNDTLWLPPGVQEQDLTATGAAVSGFETISAIVGGQWGDAECAP